VVSLALAPHYPPGGAEGRHDDGYKECAQADEKAAGYFVHGVIPSKLSLR
jgi:hypothetical protein